MVFWRQLDRLACHSNSFLEVRHLTRLFIPATKLVSKVTQTGRAVRMVFWHQLDRLACHSNSFLEVRHLACPFIPAIKLVSKVTQPPARSWLSSKLSSSSSLSSS